MISDSARLSLKRELEKLEKSVSLKVFTAEVHCPACADTIAMCDLLTELSNGKISYEEISLDTQKEIAKNYEVERAPTIIIEGTGIRYTGIPAGGGFTPFVETLIMVSTGRTDLTHLKPKLKEIKKPVVVRTVTTPTWPFCPASILLANQISIESDGIVTSDVIEAYENQDLAIKYNATGVPSTVINEERMFVGVPNLDKLIDKLVSEGKKEWYCTEKGRTYSRQRVAPLYPQFTFES